MQQKAKESIISNKKGIHIQLQTLKSRQLPQIAQIHRNQF
jgi:hypothetical protein